MKSETLLVMADFVGIDPTLAQRLASLVEYVERLESENLLGPVYARQAAHKRREYDALLERAVELEEELSTATARIAELNERASATPEQQPAKESE